jgi:prephenate dehydrogenase
MKTLGLIGFGQFGQLAASHLKGLLDITVSDTSDRSAEARNLGVKFASFEEAARCAIVIVAVPVQSMLATFKAMSPIVKPGSLIIDVASVKVLPVRWMLDSLPPYVDIVGMHPLFGPQSAKNGLKGLPLVVCPVRGLHDGRIVRFASNLGLKVSITSPEEHDREMAYVQALTHLIGRTLLELKIPDEDLKTRSYQHLLELCSLIGNDTFELFAAIQTLNPFASVVAEDFIERATLILSKAKTISSTISI